MLKKLLGVKILAAQYDDKMPNTDKELFNQAQDILGAGGSTLRAEEMLLKIRLDFPKSEYGDDVCFSLGQIFLSNNEYQKALWEYRKLLRLHPKSEHCCKAQFMGAYVLSEYIKDLEKARAAYEMVISQYPQCDLVDDAQFMIKYLGKDPSEIDFLKFDSTAGDSGMDTAAAS
jgi:TolA-binding protein